MINMAYTMYLIYVAYILATTLGLLHYPSYVMAVTTRSSSFKEQIDFVATTLQTKNETTIQIPTYATLNMKFEQQDSYPSMPPMDKPKLSSSRGAMSKRPRTKTSRNNTIPPKPTINSNKSDDEQNKPLSINVKVIDKSTFEVNGIKAQVSVLTRSSLKVRKVYSVA